MDNYISFGTWSLPYDGAANIVRSALQNGFRYIDTAAAYANEAQVGEGIRLSGLSRSEVFVSGKLWIARRGYDAAIKACKKSLRNLSLDFFDQYLIHWPADAAHDENWREINAETWQAMEQLKRDGLCARIGVCNCTPEQYAALSETSVSTLPEIVQLEFHPGFMQRETVLFYREKKLPMEAWSPLGHGMLLENPLVLAIARKHGKTAAQVLLRWCLEKEVSPITKTVSPERMRSNLDVFSFALDAEDIFALDSVEREGSGPNYTSVDDIPKEGIQ